MDSLLNTDDAAMIAAIVSAILLSVHAAIKKQELRAEERLIEPSWLILTTNRK